MVCVVVTIEKGNNTTKSVIFLTYNNGQSQKNDEMDLKLFVSKKDIEIWELKKLYCRCNKWKLREILLLYGFRGGCLTVWALGAYVHQWYKKLFFLMILNKGGGNGTKW